MKENYENCRLTVMKWPRDKLALKHIRNTLVSNTLQNSKFYPSKLPVLEPETACFAS